jgi:hypothetical protein
MGYQLAQATIVTDAVFAQRVGLPFDLRPVEFTVLTLVHENPDVSATRLAKALAVSAPNRNPQMTPLRKCSLYSKQPMEYPPSEPGASTWRRLPWLEPMQYSLLWTVKRIRPPA